jgi:hypothetical protein
MVGRVRLRIASYDILVRGPRRPVLAATSPSIRDRRNLAGGPSMSPTRRRHPLTRPELDAGTSANSPLRRQYLSSAAVSAQAAANCTTQRDDTCGRPDTRAPGTEGPPTMQPTSPDDISCLGHTVDIPTAARILGCGRTLAYELAKCDRFPCPVIRMGRRYLVPTAGLLTVLGLPTPARGDPPPRSAA